VGIVGNRSKVVCGIMHGNLLFVYVWQFMYYLTHSWEMDWVGKLEERVKELVCF